MNQLLSNSARARLGVSTRLVNWGFATDINDAYGLVAEFVGLPGDDGHKINIGRWNEEHTLKCQPLLGAHGYAFYKAWKARNG